MANFTPLALSGEHYAQAIIQNDRIYFIAGSISNDPTPGIMSGVMGNLFQDNIHFFYKSHLIHNVS